MTANHMFYLLCNGAVLSLDKALYLALNWRPAPASESASETLVESGIDTD